MKVMHKGANTWPVGGFCSMCWSPESQFPGTVTHKLMGTTTVFLWSQYLLAQLMA